MNNKNKYTLMFKVKFAFFMFFYGLVKYVPGPIPDMISQFDSVSSASNQNEPVSG